MVADVSHAFPASSRADCRRMRSNAAECGELSATDQGLESQIADWQRVLDKASDGLRNLGVRSSNLSGRANFLVKSTTHVEVPLRAIISAANWSRICRVFRTRSSPLSRSCRPHGHHWFRQEANSARGHQSMRVIDRFFITSCRQRPIQARALHRARQLAWFVAAATNVLRLLKML